MIPFGPASSVGNRHGIDLAARLLDRARAKAKDRRLDNVEFRVGDMTALSYPDGRFDAVVSVYSIFFVPDMEALVGELWRMVRPGRRRRLVDALLTTVYAAGLRVCEASRSATSTAPG